VICDGVTIGCNSVIGSDGFQVIRKNKINRRIRHFGGVYISDNAYISDNVCVDKSLFEGYTFIGTNAHIDNLVHCAHDCSVGNNAVLTAGVILSGSSKIQDGAWVGPNSTVQNRIIIGENALIGTGSVVTRDVDNDAVAYGVPAKMRK